MSGAIDASAATVHCGKLISFSGSWLPECGCNSARRNAAMQLKRHGGTSQPSLGLSLLIYAKKEEAGGGGRRREEAGGGWGRLGEAMGGRGRRPAPEEADQVEDDFQLRW